MVDKAELGKMQDFLDLKVDSWKYAKTKAKALEDRKNELSTKLSKIKGVLEDRKMQAIEDAKILVVVESSLKEIMSKEQALKSQV